MVDRPDAPGSDTSSVVNDLRDWWSHALVMATDTGDSVQRIVARVAHWAGARPEEGRRVVAELVERLERDRAQLEATVDSAVRRAVAPFRLPPRGEMDALENRLKELESRLDRLLTRRSHRS